MPGDPASDLRDALLANSEAATERARMVRAHLADRERMVFAHRRLAAVITAARRLALASDGEPWAADLLRVLGDAGVCTISAEDKREQR
jgi:hypothetical protein